METNTTRANNSNTKYEPNKTITYKIDLQPQLSKDFLTDSGYSMLQDSPHFFIKKKMFEKRYRVSASFEFMNEKWGLKINIIRDPAKMRNNDIFAIGPAVNGFHFFDDTINKLQHFMIIFEKIIEDSDLSVWRLFDPLNSTFIFFIERNFEGSVDTTVVFFSKDSWNLNAYLTKINNRII